ncbi:MAG: hypothetical protein NVSMB27_32030 [Ktedonobacteraceae bacterium]
MKLRFVGRMVACFVGVGIILALTLLGPDFFLPTAKLGYSQLHATTSSANPIVIENAHLGTTAWMIPGGSIASSEIQAYASATSVLPGQKIAFFVSTYKEGTPYLVSIYRLGWYQGYGGRLMTALGNQVGHAQGYYLHSTNALVNCSSCHIDRHTGLVEANWLPSSFLTIPSDWTSGVYLAKFTDENGMQTYEPFVVRSNSQSLYLAVLPDTTNAAYNNWGGYSLYDGANGLAKGVKVSFDRPFVHGEGTGQVLANAVDVIHWMERRGYDLSYISDVDLHTEPSQLLNHKAYLSFGHDEYWTKEMRDGVELARDKGVGLAFLGANAAYWQMRFEPDHAGNPDRTIVCYKVATQGSSLENESLSDLRRDPLFGKDNARVTAEWRDPVLARPENALVGIMFSNYTKRQLGFPWQVSSEAKSSLLSGTGLQAGHQYGCGLVGGEWDHIFTNGATPAGLQILGTTTTTDDANNHDFSNTTYYIAHSGAFVFATGSINWTIALDTYRFRNDQLCASQNPVVPGIQKLMTHIMDALVVLHATK